ncbi:MAG: hypothetical protein GF331_00325 [Chitinivibrionales bacterium]|nr:hypothetical protein [Chitinivibrionales bacterium]
MLPVLRHARSQPAGHHRPSGMLVVTIKPHSQSPHLQPTSTAMAVLSYSADEIVKTAVQIEHSAARFYRQAAENAGDGYGRLFKSLCKMENDHARIFTEMESAMSQQERGTQRYDPGNEMLYYLENMAGVHAWEGKAGPEKLLTGDETPQEVINIALRAEKEGIYFYTFLKDFVPASQGKGKVDQIIHEEMRHVAALNKYLAELERGEHPQGPAARI